MTIVNQIRQALRSQSDPLKAEFFPRFFKPEPGDTDQFLGVTVPKQRAIVKAYYKQLTPDQVVGLLHSPVHEERLTALLIWVMQYQKGDLETKQLIYNLYLANCGPIGFKNATKQAQKWGPRKTSQGVFWGINNWDLVDSSASYIVGNYIFDKDQTILKSLSRSKNVWERRIAILAAGEFIHHGEFAWTLRLAEQNLGDTHHYIHKATGWMLREVGKRDESVLCDFLDNHAHKMPRTALRYAIERLSPSKRAAYLAQKA